MEVLERMFTIELLWTRGTKLAVATVGATLLWISTLLLALSVRSVEAQVSLLTRDKIGAQASADLKFADLAPRNRGATCSTSTRTGRTTLPARRTTGRT